MSEWSNVAFGELFKTVYRYPTYFGIHYVDKGVIEIRGELLSGNGAIVEDFRFISLSTASKFPKVRLQEGDFVMSVRGTIGKIAAVKKEHEGAVITANLLRLSPDRAKAETSWLLQVFLSAKFLEQLENACSQTTIRTIQIPALSKIRLDCPPLSEQHRIAEILSTLDETIEQTEALIEKYQQIKAGLMHDLFTRGVTPDGKLRPTQAEAPQLYKESPVGWIPQEWEVYSLSTIAESLIDGPFGSNLKTEHYVPEPGVRVVRLQNIQDGIYNDADRVFVSQQHADYLSRNKVIPGDVLIAALGEDNYPPGRACCYPEGLPTAINKADCYRLRCRQDYATNAYVMHFLNTTAARKQVRRFEQGVTRHRTNVGNFRRVMVALPNVNEQNQVVELLAIASSQVESAHTAVKKLALQKHGLMHDLLTGRVRVKVDGL
jgi:type I restriction enzyme S subunit